MRYACSKLLSIRLKGSGLCEKNNKFIWGVVGLLLLSLIACSGKSENAAQSQGTEASGNAVTKYKLQFGKFLGANTSDIDGKKVIVIKAKIKSSYDNRSTINQNYFNVEDLIQKQGCDAYDEVQYWAVADMSNGEEGKVISFTVNKELIQAIKNGDVPGNKLGDYVDDLFILPSLKS